MADAIALQVDDLAAGLQRAWESLPADEDCATPRLRDENCGRRRDYMNQRGPLILAHRAWREATERLQAEEKRLLVLQQFVDEHQPILSRMRPNDPDRFVLEESFKTIRKGLQHDGGAVRERLVRWLAPRGGLRVFHGGGLNATSRQVEQYADDCRRTWSDLDAAIARVTMLLVAPAA